MTPVSCKLSSRGERAGHSPEAGTGTRGAPGVEPGGPGAPAGGEAGSLGLSSGPLARSPPQRPGCPAGPVPRPSGPRLGPRDQPGEREPTFHGRVGVRAVGKHHVHVLQLQPLQGGLQTWAASEGSSRPAWAAPTPAPAPEVEGRGRGGQGGKPMSCAGAWGAWPGFPRPMGWHGGRGRSCGVPAPKAEGV